MVTEAFGWTMKKIFNYICGSGTPTAATGIFTNYTLYFWSSSNNNSDREGVITMREYTFRDFSICSTVCDNLLFFSSSYQDAVNKAISNIVERVGELPEKLTIICSKSIIELKDKRVEPSFYEWEILDSYSETLDLENFTF